MEGYLSSAALAELANVLQGVYDGHMGKKELGNLFDDLNSSKLKAYSLREIQKHAGSHHVRGTAACMERGMYNPPHAAIYPQRGKYDLQILSI